MEESDWESESVPDGMFTPDPSSQSSPPASEAAELSVESSIKANEKIDARFKFPSCRPSEFLTQRIVRINIKESPGKDIFIYAHIEILEFHSVWFRDLLSLRKRRVETGAINLIEYDVSGQDMSLIIDWLYGANIPWSHLKYHDARIWSLESVLRLYSTADLFRFRTLQNRLIDTIRFWMAGTGSSATLDDFILAMKPSIRETPFYKFILQSCVYGLLKTSASSSTWPNDSYTMDKDLTSRIGAEVIRYHRKPYENPATFEGCQFHQHVFGMREDCTYDSEETATKEESGQFSNT